MNNVDYLVTRIKREIPIEILNLAFREVTPVNHLVPTLEANIKDTIISKWVMVDCNLVAGEETQVEVYQSDIFMETNGTIIKLPMSRTNGREIMSVLSVGFSYFITPSAGFGPTIASSAMGPESVSEPRCRITGRNTFFVEGINGYCISSARVVLENEEAFTNINVRALDKLSELCVMATKCHIYTKLRVRNANAVVTGGVDNAAIANIVNEWVDSFTMYDELLTTWKAISIYQNPMSKIRQIKLAMPY